MCRWTGLNCRSLRSASHKWHAVHRNARLEITDASREDIPFSTARHDHVQIYGGCKMMCTNRWQSKRGGRLSRRYSARSLVRWRPGAHGRNSSQWQVRLMPNTMTAAFCTFCTGRAQGRKSWTTSPPVTLTDNQYTRNWVKTPWRLVRESNPLIFAEKARPQA